MIYIVSLRYGQRRTLLKLFIVSVDSDDANSSCYLCTFNHLCSSIGERIIGQKHLLKNGCKLMKHSESMRSAHLWRELIGRLGTYCESNSSQTKDGNGRSRSYLCNVPCRSNSCNGQPEEFRVDAQDEDAGGNTVKFHIVMHKKGILTTSRQRWKHWKVSHCCAQGKLTRPRRR